MEVGWESCGGVKEVMVKRVEKEGPTLISNHKACGESGETGDDVCVQAPLLALPHTNPGFLERKVSIFYVAGVRPK